MTLSKNEQLALFIVLVLVILVAGLFIFLLPEYKKIDVNEQTLKTKQDELAAVKEELHPDKEKALIENIKTAYAEGDKISQVFYEEMTHYEADRLIRKLLAETPDPNNGELLGLDPGDMKIEKLTTHTLAINIFDEDEVGYDIKSKSVIDTSALNDGTVSSEEEDTEFNSSGSMDLEELILLMSNMTRNQGLNYYNENKGKLDNKLMTAMREFLAGESETVAIQTVEITTPLTREEMDALSVYLLNQEQATFILNYSGNGQDYDFDKDHQVQTVTDKDGEIIPVPHRFNPVLEYTIEICFLCVQRMDEPIGIG
jgi:hypothetical protein